MVRKRCLHDNKKLKWKMSIPKDEFHLRQKSIGVFFAAAKTGFSCLKQNCHDRTTTFEHDNIRT